MQCVSSILYILYDAHIIYYIYIGPKIRGWLFKTNF